MDANKTHREKTRWELDKNAVRYLQQLLEVTPNKIAAVQPPTSNLTNHSSKINKICKAQLEKQGQTQATFFFELLHLDLPVLADEQ